MKNKTQGSTESETSYASSKDEMNLLECSIFSTSGRVDKKTKSIVYEDMAFCPSKKTDVPRRLNISFSTEHGRPTSRDDLVQLAVMKISKDQGFESPVVYFTRYQILEILRWSDTGDNYRKIDEAFNRIGGTFLVWTNAWWDNMEKGWVDRRFHIFDDVQVLTRERYDDRRRQKKDGRSFVRWSDVMFESFAAGNIRSVDLGAVLNLKSGPSRRLYRWLEKHFYKNEKVEISLKELAVHKLGYREAALSEFERMLEPVFDEIIRHGHARNINLKRGKKDSLATFVRPVRCDRKDKATDVRSDRPNELQIVAALSKRGISESAAQRFVSTHELSSIRERLRAMDEQRQKGRTIEVPDAWFASALAGEFRCSARISSNSRRPERRVFHARRHVDQFARKRNPSRE